MGYSWNPSDSTAHQTAMSGGGAAAGFVMSGGGMGGTTGVLDWEKTPQYAGKVATTLLSAGAAAASGAAAFSSAAGPGGTIAGVVLGAVGIAVQGGLDAYDTQKAIAMLKKALADAKGLPAGTARKDELVEAIEYCVRKRGVKFNKSVANASIVGQPFNPLYKAGKAIYKKAMGTKGVNRAHYADLVMGLAKEPGKVGEIARLIVQTIVGEQYDNVAKKALETAFKSG